MTQSFDATAFLQHLIRIPSADPPGGELDVAKLVHSQMQALKIPSELDEFQPGRANVIGRITGQGSKPPLVFSAHLDTVPAGDQPWDFDPFAGDIQDGHIRGRGASDMKSAVAAFIAAADILNRRPQRLAGDIVLAFTAGESADCLGARRLKEQGFQSEIGAFLCGEPSSLDVIVTEKAILWLEAIAIGKIGHVSGQAGVNAIELMTEFISRLRGIQLDVAPHPLLSEPTVNVGQISGGTAIAVTPARCRATIDVRFGPLGDPDDVTRQIRTVAPEGVLINRIDFKAAVDEPADSEFVKICSTAVRSTTGRKPQILGVSYYSDGAILMEGLNVPFAIVGPGTLGMSGQLNETIPVGEVEKATQIYVRIAQDWLG